MVIGISLLGVTLFIITPIIFSVYKTNTMVLSLFGYIPPDDILMLAIKCEKYLETQLDEKMELEDYYELNGSKIPCKISKISRSTGR